MIHSVQRSSTVKVIFFVAAIAHRFVNAAALGPRRDPPRGALVVALGLLGININVAENVVRPAVARPDQLGDSELPRPLRLRHAGRGLVVGVAILAR